MFFEDQLLTLARDTKKNQLLGGFPNFFDTCRVKTQVAGGLRTLDLGLSPRDEWGLTETKLGLIGLRVIHLTVSGDCKKLETEVVSVEPLIQL